MGCDAFCVEKDETKKRAGRTARECGCQKRTTSELVVRVEWVVVGSDGLVRNAQGGAGLLQPIDGV